MWQKLNKHHFSAKRKRIVTGFILSGVIGLLLVGCGGASMMSSTTASSNSAASGASSGYNVNTQGQASASQPHATTGQQKGTTGQYGPQYLIKSLQVTMEVQNPMQSASELQQWVAFTAPQSTSDGSDYESVGNGQYAVTLTFLVDVAHYTQVEAYLRDYASQKGRTLNSLKESVQDVTNDYIDTESTLTNLRAEQQRLLSFMNQAQNVNDAVNIEQQLTQVEGQINDIEAHLNALKGQTAFYTVTVTVQPVGSVPPPPPPPSPWSVIPVWQGAWSSVVVVGQVLASILVWLIAYSVYIIPAGILIWLIRKKPWKGNVFLPFRPAIASVAAFQAHEAPAQPVQASTVSDDFAEPIAVSPDLEEANTGSAE